MVCEDWVTTTYRVPRFDYVWWMLSANPFVILGDATPTRFDSSGNPDDMFGWLKTSVRAAQIPAANGVTNAASLARFYASLVSQVDGFRLLDAERQKNVVVGPYLADMAPTGDGPVPTHFREAFRASGPSNRPEHRRAPPAPSCCPRAR